MQHQDVPIPFVGWSLQCLVGELEESPHDLDSYDNLDPPETYDTLLQTLSYVAPLGAKPLESPWTTRVFSAQYSSNLAVRKKYKPVDRKVRPVPSFMPDPSGQVFKCVEIPDLPALPFKATALINFVPTEHITLDRLTVMLKTIPDGFLSPYELDLLISVIRNREAAIAFTDAERGTFSRKYFPDYQIPVIEHTPWVQAPIQIPKAIEDTVQKMLIEQ